MDTGHGFLRILVLRFASVLLQLYGISKHPKSTQTVLTRGGSVYATVAVKYNTLPTGTGLRKVHGSALMKVGRA